MLYLIAGLLLALALAFTLWPLLRPRHGIRPVTSRVDLMRALYRDRVAELDREAGAGQLDAEIRGEVEEELGANLLDDYQQARAQADAQAAAEAAAPASGRRAALWAVALLVPVLAALVYLSVGEPAAPQIAGASEVLGLDPQTDRVRIERWRDRLEARVAARPEDGQSWFLLGVARLQLGNFAPAADAFASASERTGRDLNLDLYWLQARYLAAGGSLDERSRAIAARVLESRPDHPLVLEMYAISAYRAGDYRQAVKFLNRALGNDLSRGQFEALLAGLAQARSRMEPLNPSVDVAVSAPAAPRDATLFVIARPPGGGMPYAVVRRPARLLPLEVRLDDTVSMTDTRPLSGAEAFEVVVRLSRSGSAAPAPGDWEWRSDVLRPGAVSEPVRLAAELSPPEGRRTAARDESGAPQPGVDVAISAPQDAPRDATLFVIARPPGGGMPYAVVRRPARQLPLEVRLDDSASMMDGRRLSGADAIEVVVRLSRSGTAAAAPGDWEWRSDVLSRGELSEPVRLAAELTPLDGSADPR
jgi:cytochrome c-type biogenesis protein CcmH